MKRANLLIVISLIASLGINAGLIIYFNKDWHHREPHRAERGISPERISLQSMLDGTCEQGPITVNTRRLAVHIDNISAEIELTPIQFEKFGNLILFRARTGCAIRERQRELSNKNISENISDAEASRSFLTDMLNFREQIMNASLNQTAGQKEFLESLSDDQIVALTAFNLPDLVPGLSIDPFMNRTGRKLGTRQRRVSQQASP